MLLAVAQFEFIDAWFPRGFHSWWLSKSKVAQSHRPLFDPQPCKMMNSGMGWWVSFKLDAVATSVENPLGVSNGTFGVVLGLF